MTERMYKLAELETLLSVSRRTLRRWISTGRLRGTKQDGGFEPNHRAPWRVSESALAAFQRPRQRIAENDTHR